MRVSAVKNFNLVKAKKQSKPAFSGVQKLDVVQNDTDLKPKKSYVPGMLATIGIGFAILWATVHVFKGKTAPFSYLWK